MKDTYDKGMHFIISDGGQSRKCEENIQKITLNIIQRLQMKRKKYQLFYDINPQLTHYMYIRIRYFLTHIGIRHPIIFNCIYLDT
jgi:hypothetical protein